MASVTTCAHQSISLVRHEHITSTLCYDVSTSVYLSHTALSLNLHGGDGIAYSMVSMDLWGDLWTCAPHTFWNIDVQLVFKQATSPDSEVATTLKVGEVLANFVVIINTWYNPFDFQDSWAPSLNEQTQSLHAIKSLYARVAHGFGVSNDSQCTSSDLAQTNIAPRWIYCRGRNLCEFRREQAVVPHQHGHTGRQIAVILGYVAVELFIRSSLVSKKLGTVRTDPGQVSLGWQHPRQDWHPIREVSQTPRFSTGQLQARWGQNSLEHVSHVPLLKTSLLSHLVG